MSTAATASRLEPPAIALRRAPSRLRRRCGGESPLGRDALTRRDALGGLLVEQRGFARRAAALGGRLENHRPAVRPGRDLELVARPHVLAGLHPLPVDLDAP